MNSVEVDNMKLQVSSTRRMNVAEIKAKGKWEIFNIFKIGGGWMYLNGVLRPNPDAGGYLHGEMTGNHFFSCEFCGTYISEHITIKCVETGDLMNIGNRCISEFMIEDAQTIMRAVASLQRKVESDFKRDIHNEQLRKWLQVNIDELDRLNKEYHQNQIDEVLVSGCYEEQTAEYGEWTDEGRKKWCKHSRIGDMMPEKMFKGYTTTKVSKTIIKTRINFEGKEEAIEYVNPRFQKHIDGLKKGMNYWMKTFERYSITDWNPRTMLKSFEQTISYYNTQRIVLPKLRKLTKEERLEIGRKQQQQIDLYLKNLQKIRESNRR